MGAGQYAKIDRIDETPLVLEHGVPVSPKAKLRAGEPLQPGWHHLALTCDGKETALFVNGREAARSASAHPLLPGALGNHAKPATAFGGGLDEVRIWRAALDGKTFAAWMAREPDTDHPQRAALAAWWSFDEMDAEINPHFPALRSDPMALSGAFRRKQSPWRQPKPCETGMALVNQNN